MKQLLKRYRFFIALLIINGVLLYLYPEVGRKSWNVSWSSFLQMIAFIPPIFILLGLLDVWVDRQTMIKLMGENSGFLGIAIAFVLGSVAAGPLYAAFPIAGVLLKKGSKFSNILVFIGAWSTTKIPMLLFETSAMGWKFMLTRFVIDIPGIALIAFLTDRILSNQDKEVIYAKAAEA
jgi:uncharacterized membrane protein YraQ (UPF0718 family)